MIPNFGQWTSEPKKPADPKKISGRGNKYGSALISEGSGLAGAAAGAAIGSVVPVIGTGIGALVGGGIGAFGGRLVENKVRDNEYGGWSAAQEGAFNMIPFGTVAGKGAKGFKAAKAAGHVWHDTIEEAPMFEIDDSASKVFPERLQAKPRPIPTDPLTASQRKRYERLQLRRNSYYLSSTDENWYKKIQPLVVQHSEAVNAAQFPMTPTARLEDVLSHPELYKQYPDLKDVPVMSQVGYHGAQGETDGSYIGIAESELASPQKLRKTLLHETQHVVDDKEKWSAGGSPKQMGDARATQNYVISTQTRNLLKSPAAKMVEEDLSKTSPKIKNWLGVHGLLTASDDTLGKFAEAADVPVQQLEALRSTSHGAMLRQELADLDASRKAVPGYGMSDFDAYQRLPSEARARATAARMDMPMSERYKMPDDILSERARKHTKLEDYLQDLNDSGQPVLYHGGAPDGELTNNQFFGDFYQHAAEYADGWNTPGKVHAVKYKPDDLMYFNQNVFKDMKDNYRNISTKELNSIYADAIKNGTLGDAQMQGDISDKAVVPYIKKLLSSDNIHENNKVNNDLLLPLMQHYSRRKGKHIVGFEGGDFMGADEYVVGDLSKTTNLDDIFKTANKPRSTFYDSLDVPKEDLIVRPAGVGGTSMFVRRPDKPTELMATHNLTADNLLHADKLGGLPQPSVGVVDPKKGIIDGFGEITLIGNEKLVDPKAPKTKTFGSDVYSPRQPMSKTKMDFEQQRALHAELQDTLDKYSYKTSESTPAYINFGGYDNVVDDLQSDAGVMAHFLKSKGIEPNVPTKNPNSIGLSDDKPTRWNYTDNYRTQLQDNNLVAEFQRYTTDLAKKHGAEPMLFGGWSPSGAKRELPETLDNALKIMRKDPMRAGEGHYGIGSLRAQVTPAFKSIDDIYENKNKLVKTDDFEEVKNQLHREYEELGSKVQEVANRKGINISDSNDALDQYLTYPVGSSWNKLFREKWGEVADDIDEFRDKLKYAPTEYFESVSDRAVKLSEFEKALVPHDTPQTVLDKLKGHGIESLIYGGTMRADLPTRTTLIKKLMDEDNAKRFPKENYEHLWSHMPKPAATRVGEKDNYLAWKKQYPEEVKAAELYAAGEFGKLTPKTSAAPEPAPKIFREGGEQYKENGTELVARERFNIPALKKISSGGSDRDVYDLGDGHVLKVSKTARGLAQNDAEVDYFAQGEGLIPETVEAGKNYVVSVKVNKPDKATKAMVREMADKFGYSDFEKKTPELQEFLEKHDLSEILNYDIASGDYTAIRNWGTTADGKPIHVDGGTLNKSILHDKMKYQQYKSNGYSTAEFKSNYPNATAYKKNLDDPEFSAIYHKSKAAKKKYADMDKATMYGIAGLLGGGVVASKAVQSDNEYGGWSTS